MNNLWAPWRMEYILGEDKPEGCIFCPNGVTGPDRERLILHVGQRVMIIMNRYPYNNGHLLVAPLRHVGRPTDIDERETADLWDAVNKVTGVLTELMNPDGFNIGLNLGRSAGAGVEDHFHVHIVPRWTGDTNFMTVFGEVRSIPEHIEQTFDRLRPLIAKAFGEA